MNYQLEQIDINLIDTDEMYQPRKELNGITKLAASIAAHGQKTPAIVFRVNDRYMLVGGHRRLAALRKNRADTMLCLVHDGKDAALDALLDNNFRENLTEQEAAGYIQERLLDVSADKLATVIGVTTDKAESIVTGARINKECGTTQDQLTFDQLQLLAQFDGDDEAIKELVKYGDRVDRWVANNIQRRRDLARKTEENQALAAEHGLTWCGGIELGVVTRINDRRLTLAEPCGCDGACAWQSYDGTMIIGCSKPENHLDKDAIEAELQQREREEQQKKDIAESAENRVKFVAQLSQLDPKALLKLEIAQSAYERILLLDIGDWQEAAKRTFAFDIELCDLRPATPGMVLLATSAECEEYIDNWHRYRHYRQEDIAIHLNRYLSGLRAAGFVPTEGDHLIQQLVDDEMFEASK